jgi:YidC/Oxa1 family membrane protein insertase
MRLLLRVAIALGAIVIFSGGPAARAQDFGTLFQKADQLEKEGKYQDVLREYGEIVRNNQRTNPEAAAEALYRGGQFAQDPKRYGLTAEERKQGKTASPDMQRQGEDAAVQMWKQLYDQFPNTKAFAKIDRPQPGQTRSLFDKLKDKIDRRNSGDWKYQMLDTLVGLTGRNRNFSYAFALILLAVLVRLLLWPLTRKQYAAMREMQRMQPLIKELQGKYKGAELSQKTMELYKEHGVNPFASCLPLLLQMPFLFMVFAAIREYEFAFSYGKFLWIGSALSTEYPHIVARNLSLPDIPLLVVYSLSNYVTMKMTPATDPQQQQQQNTMGIIMSGMMFYMFLIYRWSSAFVLYWTMTNLLMIWQQYHNVYKPHKMKQLAGVPVVAATDTGAAKKNGASAARADEKPLGAGANPTRVRPRKKQHRPKR